MNGWDRTITFLVPVVMFGWIPFTAALFYKMTETRAILVSVIGGVMFLPVATYSLSGFPDLNKQAVIAISILIGSFFSRQPRGPITEWSIYDIPMALWCFMVPIATSLTNNLGVYNGISRSLQICLNWGIFYWAGRRYFSERNTFRELCIGIILGGLIYVPLTAFELRMSPQLSQWFYGFFPHSWLQHIRYGGYRPVVFMRHGLMVSFWMAISATVAYWFWRAKIITRIAGIPMGLAVLVLIIITILCKSANGWFFLTMGILSFSLYKRGVLVRLLHIMILFIPFYFLFRLFNVITTENIQSIAFLIFEDERVASLSVRLLQESAFGEKALQRPWWGWGGYDRGWPVDPLTGELIVRAVDSQWIVVLSRHGLIGLISLFSSLLFGPWFVIRLARDRIKKHKGYAKGNMHQFGSILLSLVVIFFVIDSLVNASMIPVYILSAGALLGSCVNESYYLKRRVPDLYSKGYS